MRAVLVRSSHGSLWLIYFATHRAIKTNENIVNCLEHAKWRTSPCVTTVQVLLHWLAQIWAVLWDPVNISHSLGCSFVTDPTRKKKTVECTRLPAEKTWKSRSRWPGSSLYSSHHQLWHNHESAEGFLKHRVFECLSFEAGIMHGVDQVLNSFDSVTGFTIVQGASTSGHGINSEEDEQ